MANSPKRILIVAGEASADRYGARLVRQLCRLHGAGRLEFYGTGGDEMAEAGVDLLCHARTLAHIGVWEAVCHMRTYYQTYRRILTAAVERRPHLAVLLDFPEFNLRLAREMKRMGVRVVYYIGPQIWAWRGGRIRTVREYVDKMLVILPFEEQYYRQRGVEAEFVGHPLMEDFAPYCGRDAFLTHLGLQPDRKTLAILAGSRRREIEYILPPLLRASQLILKQMPAQFLISVAPTVDREHIERITAKVLGRDPNRIYFRIVRESARDILASSDFAFVKSGTSSLEAALVGTPFVITYKISPLSWFIGSILIHTSFKGLVNLIAGEEIVPELFQHEAQPHKLAQAALEILNNPEQEAAMRSRLMGIGRLLGSRVASQAAAAAISAYL